MLDLLKTWYQKNFSDPQAVYLALVLVIGFSVVILAGKTLLPVFASIVIAFLLEVPVQLVKRTGLGRSLSVYVVFTLFIALLVLIAFGLVPSLVKQVAEFVQAVPDMVVQGQAALLRLPEAYSFIDEEQVKRLIAAIGKEVGALGHGIATKSIASLSNVITITVYLVLMPLLVFFFLKDKWKILMWFDSYLPKERTLMTEVWFDMDRQLGNYIRGKVWEILIVGGVSSFVFALLGLQYALLLGALVGLSVLVPYIGAVVVTFPVLLVAYFQWGWTPDFAYLVIAFAIIQTLDGVVLVPVMFSEVVNLHPIAIIVAVLGFGALWGFWGVFFAIPLATLVQALLVSWPTNADTEAPEGSG